jgi:hypothetical protein
VIYMAEQMEELGNFLRHLSKASNSLSRVEHSKCNHYPRGPTSYHCQNRDCFNKNFGGTQTFKL